METSAVTNLPEDHPPQPKKKWYEISQYRTLVTPRASVITLFIMGAIFMGLGILFLYLSQNLVDYKVRYDDVCQGQANCFVTFNISQDLDGNLALLFSLKGFYQNHRRIVDSISYPQLEGKYLTYRELSTCSPQISENSSKLPQELYVPCGLLPGSFFNDSYLLPDGPPFDNFTDVNISIQSDRQLYKPFNERYNDSLQWLNNYTDFPGSNMNEHFLVWIRTAAMPTLMKLYMKCNNCRLAKGQYQVQIRMNYPQSMFPGERWLVLSKTGPLGSGSNFIAIAYMSAGGLGLAFAIAFLIHMLACPRRFGDLSMLWQTHDMGQLGVAVNPRTEHIEVDLLPMESSKADDAEERMEATPSNPGPDLELAELHD